MKSKLHSYDQMTEWVRSKPDADDPSHEFYDYSELAFVKECQKQVRLPDAFQEDRNVQANRGCVQAYNSGIGRKHMSGDVFFSIFVIAFFLVCAEIASP